jgi:hypothetical protein
LENSFKIWYRCIVKCLFSFSTRYRLIYLYSISVIVWFLILFQYFLLISIRYRTSNRKISFLFAESHTTLCVFIYSIFSTHSDTKYVF